MPKKLLVIMDWIWRLTWLNFLWIVFSLPLVTIIPSTFAMFSVVNSWIKDDVDIEIFPTFLKGFKRYILRSLPLGSLIIIIAVFLYADFLILNGQTEGILLILHYAILIAVILYVPIALYSIPVYLELDLKWYKSMPVALILAMRRPVHTFLVLCGISLVLILVLFVTGFGILFVGSLFALIVSRAAISGLKTI